MDKTETEQVHATAVSLRLPGEGEERRGVVLLRGPSGSGKSDLALRLISDHGGVLVSDDQVIVARAGEKLFCHAPPAISGLLEVRGLGLVHLPADRQEASVVLIVDLVSSRDDVARLPEPRTAMLCNIAVACLRLYAFDASTPAKIRMALAVVKDPDLVVR